MSYAQPGSQLRLPNRNCAPFKHSLRLKNSINRNGVIRYQHGGESYSFIVHCHLCWDWVWQRPQQFMSRLSARHKILFVETVRPDPQLVSPLARFRIEENFPNVTILQVQFPEWR